MPEIKTVNYNDLFGDAKDVAVDPSLFSSFSAPVQHPTNIDTGESEKDVIEKSKKFIEEEAAKDEIKDSKYLSFMHEHLGDAAHYAEQFASGLTLGYAPVEAKKDEGLISDILSEGSYLAGMGVNMAVLPWDSAVELGGSLLEATGIVPKVVSTLARSNKIIGTALKSGGIGALYGSFEKKSKEESRLQHVVKTGTAFALFSGAGGAAEEVASKLSPTIKNVLLKVGRREALTKADKRILKAFHIGEGMAVGAGAGFVRPAKDIKERFRNAGVGAGSFGLVQAVSPMRKSAKGEKTEEDVATPEQIEKDVSPGLKLLKPKDISERRYEGLEAKEQRTKIKNRINAIVEANRDSKTDAEKIKEEIASKIPARQAPGLKSLSPQEYLERRQRELRGDKNPEDIKRKIQSVARRYKNIDGGEEKRQASAVTRKDTQKKALSLLREKDISERRGEGLEAKEQRKQIEHKIKAIVRENIKKNTPLLARKNEELIKAVVKEAEQKEAPKAEQPEMKTEARDKQGTAAPQEETPVNTGEERVAPTEDAVNRAQESEKGIPLQEDVVQPEIEEIRTKAGLPFKNKGALVMSLKKKGLYETHEPVQTEDGWVGRPKPTEQEQAEALKAFAEERGIPFVEGEEITKETQENKEKTQPPEQPENLPTKESERTTEKTKGLQGMSEISSSKRDVGGESGQPSKTEKTKISIPPFRDFRVKQTSTNSAVLYPNRIGAKFSGEQIAILKGWAKQNNLYVGEASPTKIKIIRPDLVPLDLSAHGAKGVKAETYEGKKRATEKAREEKKKYLKEDFYKRPSAKWIEDVFGEDFANVFNKNALADFLEGKVRKPAFLPTWKWKDGLDKLNALDSQGKIDWGKIKEAYESTPKERSKKAAGKLPEANTEKQPWEMGLLEYAKKELVRMGKPETADQVTEPKQVKSFSAQHKKEIRAAQERGEKIPRHVLEEYKGEEWADKALENIKEAPEEAPDTQKRVQTKPSLLPEDIDRIKSKFKGQEIEETKDGKVRIKLKNGATITVTSLDKDADNNTILTAKGEVLGKTKGTEIKLNLSKADGTTLTHEIKHALDNLGVISKHENRLIETEFLRRKQKGTLPFEPSRNPDKNIAREENIAEMFSHMLKEREQYRKGAIGRLVQKTGDIIDALKHVGQASLRKLALETETGKIFEREPIGEVRDVTRYKIDEKVPPEKVEKDFLETRDSLARSFVNMIKGNAKFRNDVFKNDKEDLYVAENILGTTMFNAKRVGGAYERLYDNVLVKIPDFKLERQKYLRGEGDASWLKPLTDLKKRNKILYRRLNNYIVGKDINAEGYKVVKKGNGFVIKDPKGKIVGQDTDFDAAYLKAFKDEAEATGFSDLEKDALIAYRKMSLRLYHHYADGIKEIIATCKEAGIPTPKVVTIEKGKEVKIDLQTAMKKMGERIGYYFPRERQRGAYRVDATKDGEPTQTKFFKTKVAARTYKEEMVRKGYSVEESNIGLFSEDLYQDLAPLLAQEQIINKALEKLPEGTDVKTEIAKAIANQYSALLKSHGSRARMIRRSDAVGDEVKRGYETDLVKAIASATEAAAGGWAKQRAAIDGIKIITGRDIPFEEYQKEHPDATKEDYYKFCEERKIDASRQDTIYKEATAALKDVLRNNELADNIIGAVKSVAVVKFIALKVLSAAVNLTTLLTSVPATLKGELEIPWRDTFDALGKAVGEYAKFRAYRLGDKITGKGKKPSLSPLFDRIEEKGFDVPQYNREAVDALEGRLGTAWRHFVEASMYLFGATERINRATTIAATYMAIARRAGKPLFENGKVNDKWLEDARKISNQAHGSYGKDDRLHMARGTSPTARVLQLYTVFMKFSHTYLQEFVRLGAVKKQYGAALYMALSPMIFGGIGATIPMAIAKVYHRIFNTPEDPEETFLRAMGNSDFLRYGIPAVAGISLKGSLAMDFTPPKEIIDIFGAPGSLVRDEYEGVKNLTKGYYEQAAEKMLPSGLSKPLKAHRERTQGITTASGRPVFFGNKKLKLSKHDAWLMMFSFNPMGIDKKRTILYNEYEKKKWFRSKKADIYRDIRLFYSVPEEERSDAVAIKIKAEIANFNALIKKYDAEDFVTPIGSLKRLFREINLPPKRERTREVEE